MSNFNSLLESLRKSPPRTPPRPLSTISSYNGINIPSGSKASDLPSGSGRKDGKMSPTLGLSFNKASPSESQSTPGRMENLRVLIEEAKRAAAEGRLSASIRKYETALVTLPEAYKPRVQNKIAKLEARLEAEEEQKDDGVGSPRSQSRLMGKLHRGIGNTGACLGPLDLLHIAVKDVASSERLAGARSVPSSWRSSPLARGPCSITGSMHSSRVKSREGSDHERSPEDPSIVPFEEESEEKEGGGTRESDEDADADEGEREREQVDRGEDEEEERVWRVARDHDVERLVEDTGTLVSRLDVEGQSQEHGAGSCTASSGSAGGFPVSSDIDSSVEGAWASEDEKPFGMEDCIQRERLRSINKALSGTLERQVVDRMNQASYEELINLHGIGFRRAQRILRERAAAPFKGLADLSRIGMFPKQIEKMGKHNMLECLDLCQGRPDLAPKTA